jgi:hypothetical protein
VTTSETPGAGAWVRPHYYSRTTVGRDISSAVDGVDKRRIRLAAGSIQRELMIRGYLPITSHCDGVFGPKTHAAIKTFQARWNATKPASEPALDVDGAVGPKSMRALCWPLIVAEQSFGPYLDPPQVAIPDNLLYGEIALESNFDPGAQGEDRTRSTDRGLAQISDEAFEWVLDSTAYGDIRFSIAFAGLHMRQSRRREADAQSYGEQGHWDEAIANHNNPTKADEWYDTGVAPVGPNEQPPGQIANYVRLVRKLALLAPR